MGLPYWHIILVYYTSVGLFRNISWHQSVHGKFYNEILSAVDYWRTIVESLVSPMYCIIVQILYAHCWMNFAPWKQFSQDRASPLSARMQMFSVESNEIMLNRYNPIQLHSKSWSMTTWLQDKKSYCIQFIAFDWR